MIFNETSEDAHTVCATPTVACYKEVGAYLSHSTDSSLLARKILV